MSTRAGIDLGTTYSAVAYYDETTGKPIILNNSYDKELTPSVISFLDDGDVLIGEEAADMMSSGVGTCISAFKRMMGDDKVLVSAGGKDYTSENLSTLLLKRLIDDASARLRKKIDEVVITVPAYFDNDCRRSTIRAGEACGVKVLNLINEPTSAALYYGYKHADLKTVMVYDLGGGTFDVNIINFENGKTTVLGTDGNRLLGGKDWDKALMDIACDRFRDEYEIDPRLDPVCSAELMSQAEDKKRILSKANSTLFQIDYQGCSARYNITREEFEDASEEHLMATKNICDRLLNTISMKWSDIDEILLIGGSSRMPMVASFLQATTGLVAVQHPDMELAVAKGASIAARFYRDQISTGVFQDVTAHSLGALSVSEEGDRYVNEIMIKRNSRIPSRMRKQFRIERGNMTDVIEVYAMQGESENPEECLPISRCEISGFKNDGEGVVIDVEYSYENNGVVRVRGFVNHDQELRVKPCPIPDDMTWVGGSPRDRPNRKHTEKNIVICLDLSRSMTFAKKDEIPPIDVAKKAIKDFVHELKKEGAKFALVGFGDRVLLLCDLTSDVDRFMTALDEADAMDAGRGTTSMPIGEAEAILKTESKCGIIVILTDGIWKAHKDESVQQSRKCRSEGISIFAIGVGQADRAFLGQIATVQNGALYTTVDNLGDTFSTIATVIKMDHFNLRSRE
ncbi:MAG: Hsp70 family protein [Candidatus Methanomethylophilaceae archaeon]|nr:Hsp70 family protein [Candidatus Methanomethylophilaceae archaeon]